MRSILVVSLALAACNEPTSTVQDIAGPKTQRLHFNVGDSSLKGAEQFELNASIGLSTTDAKTTYLHTLGDGSLVQFDFAAGGGHGLLMAASGDLVSETDGVTIDISPPAGAIGLMFNSAECSGSIEFRGATSTESHTFESDEHHLFAGAADIGDIDRVTLDAGCYASWWTELRFDPTSGAFPSKDADVGIIKAGPSGAISQTDSPISYTMTLSNTGPDDADNVTVTDFLYLGGNLVHSSPTATVLSEGRLTEQHLGTVINGASNTATMQTTVPPFAPSGVAAGTFNCGMTLVNVGLVSSSAVDGNAGNNRSIAVNRFDDASRYDTSEVCDNGVDDNCDGRTDCSDSDCHQEPHCRPPVMPVPSDPTSDCYDYEIAGQPCPFPSDPPDPGTGQCTGFDFRTSRELNFPSCCCSSLAGTVGCWADLCGPLDPNHKEADPPINVLGYGVTGPGQVHRYSVTYENIGGGDAHDVLVVDALDEDLDDSTLTIEDGGVYDATTRVITWNDPVVIPNDPRTVHFSVGVRDDAEPLVQVHNQATIVFPDAVPPTRIDTNLVVHSVPDPRDPYDVDMGVLGCKHVGDDEHQVLLYNRGAAFGFNVDAKIVDAPDAVTVTDGSCAFAAIDEEDPAVLRTVAPRRTTGSLDTVSFTSQTAGDPCKALTWEISWQDSPAGPVKTRTVQVSDDDDKDAVDDEHDNCLGLKNPEQADKDNNGVGDACEDLDDPVDSEFLGSCGCSNTQAGALTLPGLLVLFGRRRRRRS